MTLTRLSAQLLKTGSDGALPITSSFAITASYAMNGGSSGAGFPFTGDAVITGSLRVSGSGGITGSMNIERYTLNTSSLGNASGSMSIDLRNGNFFTATTTNTTTWQFTNAPGGRAIGFVLELTNGGVSASIWPTGTRWAQGITPPLTVSGVDILTFITDDAGTNWRGVVSMLDSR